MTAWQVRLERRWTEPHRHHHDREHLTEVLTALDALQAAGEPFDVDVVRTAAWFHDAVYDPRRDDSEARSADLALDLLTGPRAVEVARLVRVTHGHVTEPGDDDAAALCDADLSVLAADPERYRRYATEVRREYAHVPDTEFGRRRAEILAGFLGRSRLYATPSGHTWWEERARQNLATEIGTLLG